MATVPTWASGDEVTQWYAYKSAQLRSIDQDVSAEWLETHLNEEKGYVGRVAGGLSRALAVAGYGTVAQLAHMTHGCMKAVDENGSQVIERSLGQAQQTHQ